MKEQVIFVRNYILRFLYKAILQKIFFLQDPEIIHDRMLNVGRFLGKFSLTRWLVSLLFSYQDKTLSQEILGIKFANPIGLGAGFDKDAVLTDTLPGVGFGFIEVGSITGEACAGNLKPRLWRLKKSKALVVNYGLKNEGSEAIAKSLKGKTFKIPLGTNIAKTNSPNTVKVENGIADYAKAFKEFVQIGDYFTVNISCPNAYGGQPFTDANRLDKLLRRLDEISTKKPIFLKLSPDLSQSEIDRILAISNKHQVAGFICSNLTKNRNNRKIKDSVEGTEGGISGKVVENLANNLISYIYRKTKGKFVIIGLGGVFCAEDAYKKIKLGASLVELITGMIFEGPQVISEINQGLAKLLKKDGFSNISQARGIDSYDI